MSELAGQTIGDYQLIEMLDDEGDVVVFKGTQVSTNQTVAIKAVNLDEAKDKTAVQTFTQQAELAARVQHPNLLPVLDSGQVKNVGYFVTPFMENRSVADHRSSFTDPQQVLALFKALAPGLEAIYSHGSIHGNLGVGQLFLLPNAVHAFLDVVAAKQTAQHQQIWKYSFDNAHLNYYRRITLPNSRRLKIQIPNATNGPPCSTTWNKASRKICLKPIKYPRASG